MNDTDRHSGPSGDDDRASASAAGVLAATYLGATADELGLVHGFARLAAMSDQRRLFPHQGRIELRGDALVLEGWRTIRRERITNVELTFTDVYSRWMAGGVRGGRNASFGLFGNLGKPLVLHLVGDGQIYLLIDFSWFSGINQARRWFPTITSWAEQGRIS